MEDRECLKNQFTETVYLEKLIVRLVNPITVVVVYCVELPTGAEEAVSRQSQSEAISRDAAGGSGEVRHTAAPS